MGPRGEKTAWHISLVMTVSALCCFVAAPIATGSEAKETSQEAGSGPGGEAVKGEHSSPRVILRTSAGEIVLELDRKLAPVTVENFLQYASDGFYNGTLFHRVIPGFMIQGGGMEPGMKQKPSRSPIRNEAANGLKNRTGTVAMARTSDVDSATSQFFINCKDNAFLNHRNTSPQGYGYAVFGKVVAGMEVVRKIENIPTGAKGPYRDVPQEDVLIVSVEIQKP